MRVDLEEASAARADWTSAVRDNLWRCADPTETAAGLCV